jgi:hypothetical protein
MKGLSNEGPRTARGIETRMTGSILRDDGDKAKDAGTDSWKSVRNLL